MDGNAIAGQTRSSQPGAEEYTHVAVGVGEATHAAAKPCKLCAALVPSGAANCRQPQPCTGNGLRIALVAGDQGVRRACQKMMQSQRDGWDLHIYDPCRLACHAAARRGPPRLELEVPRACLSTPPDVVLLGLPEHDGTCLACVRTIKALAPRLPVLVISGDCDAASVGESCAAGANGYLLKSLAPEELARAVALAAQGWPALCREAQKALLNVVHQSATATTPWFPGLTGREQEIAGSLVARLRDKEIADRLRMTRSTVHVHLVRLYRKLGVHSRQQAVGRLLGVGVGESNPF